MQASIISLTLSLGEETTVSVDNHILSKIDLSYHKGHFYSGLSPGLSYLLVPHYLIYGKAFARLLDKNSCSLYTFIFSPFSTSLIVSFSMVFLYLLLVNMGYPKAISESLTFLCAFGTLFLVYGSTLSSRPIASSLPIVVFYLIHSNKNKTDEAPVGIPFLGGLLLGIVICFDYAALLFTPFLGFYFLYDNLRARTDVRTKLLRTIMFISGWSIPIIFLLIYHYVAFGDPFATAYDFRYGASQIEYHSEGLAGVTYPKLVPLINLLFFPSKGLLFFMPTFYLSFYGCYVAVKTRNPELILSGCLMFLFILYNASIKEWSGNACYGPRLLMESIPFSIILLAPVVCRMRKGLVYPFFGYAYFVSFVGAFFKYSSIPTKYDPVSFLYYIVTFLGKGIEIPALSKFRLLSDSCILLVCLNYIVFAFLLVFFLFILSGLSINRIIRQLACFVSNVNVWNFVKVGFFIIAFASFIVSVNVSIFKSIVPVIELFTTTLLNCSAVVSFFVIFRKILTDEGVWRP